MRKHAIGRRKFMLIGAVVAYFFCIIVSQSAAYTYHWERNETPEGSESTTIVDPIEVTLL